MLLSFFPIKSKSPTPYKKKGGGVLIYAREQQNIE
jgi:hypothetical protein